MFMTEDGIEFTGEESLMNRLCRRYGRGMRLKSSIDTAAWDLILDTERPLLKLSHRHGAIRKCRTFGNVKAVSIHPIISLVGQNVWLRRRKS